MRLAARNRMAAGASGILERYLLSRQRDA